MYERVSNGELRDEYCRGVCAFLVYAYKHRAFVDGDGRIICPCIKCRLMKKHTREDVHLHLYRYSFVEDYRCWTQHGENYPEANDQRATSDTSNPMVDMMIDLGADQHTDEEPYGESEDFYKLMKKAEEPLWSISEPSVYQNYTKLGAISELLATKIQYNMTDTCFDVILGKLKKMLPEGNELPRNYYETKKMMRTLGLVEEKIHACVNHCMIYYGEHAVSRMSPPSL